MADAYSWSRPGAQETGRGDRVTGSLWADTGTLANVTIRGRAQVGAQGAIFSGMTAYNDGAGFWLEAGNGIPRFALGNSMSDHLTWDGSALSISGGMTVSSGTIAGWNVATKTLSKSDATLSSDGYLALGTGNDILRADASNASYRLWIGGSNAATAPFRVAKDGSAVIQNITVGAGTIPGSTIGSGINGGNLTSGTVASGAIAAGAITADKIGVSSLAAISANLGTITAGTINAANITVTNLSASHLTQSGTLGADQNLGGSDLVVNGTGQIQFGGNDYLGSNVLHFEVGSSETAKIEWKNGANTPAGYLSGAVSASSAAVWVRGQYNANYWGNLQTYGASTYGFASLTAQGGGGTRVSSVEVTGHATLSSCSILFTVGTVAVAVMENTNRATRFYGYVYPGSGSGAQTSRYLFDANSRLSSYGVWDFTGSTVGGSAANWSTFTTTNIPDKSAGYFLMYINGTACRVPFYANG